MADQQPDVLSELISENPYAVASLSGAVITLWLFEFWLLAPVCSFAAICSGMYSLQHADSDRGKVFSGVAVGVAILVFAVYCLLHSGLTG